MYHHHHHHHHHHQHHHHHAVSLTAGPHTLPQSVLHTGRSSASPFNFQYSFVSLEAFSSCLRLLPTYKGTCVPVRATKAYRGSNGTTPLILNLAKRCGECSAWSPGRFTAVSTDQKNRRPQHRWQRFEEEVCNSVSNRTTLPWTVGRSLVAMPTELLWLTLT